MTQFKTPYEDQQFYEWRGVGEYWLKNEDSFDSDFPSRPHDPNDFSKENSLAAHIIETIFELELDDQDKSKYGSYLPGYDVKNRDAYQMIQLSLASELADLEFIECYADPNGIVKFYPIGQDRADIDDYILKSLTTSTLKQKCDNVLVVGYDPPPKKFMRLPGGVPEDTIDVGIDLFTFGREIDDDTFVHYQALYGTEAAELVREDTDYPKYWAFSSFLNPEACEYAREGCIEYRDIHMMDEKYLVNAEILKNRQFEKIASWMYKIQVPFFNQESTTIDFSQKAFRYQELSSMGELQPVSWERDNKYVSKLCVKEDEVDPSKGIFLPASNNPQFLGVRDVYIYGFELKQITLDEQYDEVDGVLTTKPGIADFLVDLDTMVGEPFKLSQGQDYVVVKNPVTDGDEEAGGYKIVFAANVNPNYTRLFGGDVGFTVNPLEAARKFRVARTSLYEKDGVTPMCTDRGRFSLDECLGWFRDGSGFQDLEETKEAILVSNKDIFSGCIFPTGQGNSGYVIDKVVVVYDWDNPAVIVRDLDNNVTEENLRTINVEVFPIITQDLPPPIAHKSRNQPAVLLDPRQQIPDLEPETVQNLYDTAYQRALNEVENGDIKINLPFIGVDGYPWEEGLESTVDADRLKNVAALIYELQNEEVEETTYVCAPDANPVLGQTIDGKTINSIDYSYQDSSQFLISVNAGPVWRGMGGWSTSVYQNQTERIQLEGVIREINEDNTKCLVQLERIGLMECVNGQTDKLEVGDSVKVTVYNNPVSR